jgi:hypothetical protein
MLQILLSQIDIRKVIIVLFFVCSVDIKVMIAHTNWSQDHELDEVAESKYLIQDQDQVKQQAD